MPDSMAGFSRGGCTVPHEWQSPVCSVGTDRGCNTCCGGREGLAPLRRKRKPDLVAGVGRDSRELGSTRRLYMNEERFAIRRIRKGGRVKIGGRWFRPQEHH